MHCDAVLHVLFLSVSCTVQHCAAICNKPFINCRKTASSVISDAASVVSQQRSTQNSSFDNYLAAEQTGIRTFELLKVHSI